MEQTVKTLTLEAVTGSGPGHIREIHLRVTGFRPEVPERRPRGAFKAVWEWLLWPVSGKSRPVQRGFVYRPQAMGEFDL